MPAHNGVPPAAANPSTGSSAPAAGKSRNRILELDGLRAFAVLSVVIYHIGIYSGGVPKPPPFVASILECIGLQGVFTFFIISGFIITRLLIREKTAQGRVSLGNFYIRRFFRIIPPFAAYLLVLLVLRTFGLVTVSNRNFFISAIFLGDTTLFGPDPWLVGHTWSLSVEEQFYLIFPPLLCYVFGFRTRATLILLGLFYAVCVLALRLAIVSSAHFGSAWTSLWYLYYFRYIICGMVIAIYEPWVLRWVAHPSRFVPLALALAIFGLFMLDGPFRPSSAAIRAAVSATAPCISGLFVMWFVQNPSQCRFLCWPLIQWLGACSYSIYLWQQLFTAPPAYYHGWNWSSPLLACTATLVCAAASRYLVETPCIALGHRICKRRILLKSAPHANLPEPI